MDSNIIDWKVYFEASFSCQSLQQTYKIISGMKKKKSIHWMQSLSNCHCHFVNFTAFIEWLCIQHICSHTALFAFAMNEHIVCILKVYPFDHVINKLRIDYCIPSVSVANSNIYIIWRHVGWVNVKWHGVVYILHGCGSLYSIGNSLNSLQCVSTINKTV